jgi:hypothetical protein
MLERSNLTSNVLPFAAEPEPRIATTKDLRDNRRRYYCGIVLNEAGLRFHDAGFNNRDLEGKTANATAPKETVNQVMTPDWLEKPSVKAMRDRQAVDGGSRVSVLFPEKDLSP